MKKLKLLLIYIISLALITLATWIYLLIILSDGQIFLDPKEYKIKQYELSTIQNLQIEKWIFEKDGHNYAILINPGVPFKIVKVIISSQLLYTILFIIIVLLIIGLSGKSELKAIMSGTGQREVQVLGCVKVKRKEVENSDEQSQQN
jgi:hypothetical protein